MPVLGSTTHDLEKDPLTAQPDTMYGADDLTHLEGLDAVRKRPGMYIGSTDSRGINHLFNEIVEDQAQSQADIAAMARKYDDPAMAEEEIRTQFQRQRRVSFRLRPAAIHSELGGD